MKCVCVCVFCIHTGNGACCTWYLITNKFRRSPRDVDPTHHFPLNERIAGARLQCIARYSREIAIALTHLYTHTHSRDTHKHLSRASADTNIALLFTCSVERTCFTSLNVGAHHYFVVDRACAPQNVFFYTTAERAHIRDVYT